MARWLVKTKAAGEADWDSVIWIDDVLGPGASKWAHGHHQPVLLEKPIPDQGLTWAHVVAVEVFIERGGGGVEAPAPETDGAGPPGCGVEILLQGDALGGNVGGVLRADEA